MPVLADDFVHTLGISIRLIIEGDKIRLQNINDGIIVLNPIFT